MSDWDDSQNWEKDWWGTCQNTFGEETKQLLYAKKMGLETFHDGKSPFNFDMKGATVLDIGGGPTSLLLKCVNVKGMVIDPLPFQVWVQERYKCAEILFERGKGENVKEGGFDEVWIYNTLQHVDNPREVIKRAKKAGKIIRVFEFIDTPTNEGHPHKLTERLLNRWLGGEGKVERLKGENTIVGKVYYGIFLGK